MMEREPGSPDNQLKRITGLIFPSVSGSFLAIFFMNFLHFCFYFETVSLCVGTGESASEKVLCWADYLFLSYLNLCWAEFHQNYCVLPWPSAKHVTVLMLKVLTLVIIK